MQVPVEFVDFIIGSIKLFIVIRYINLSRSQGKMLASAMDEFFGLSLQNLALCNVTGCCRVGDAKPLWGDVQGGPRKVKPTTILLVTFECVGKIQ